MLTHETLGGIFILVLICLHVLDCFVLPPTCLRASELVSTVTWTEILWIFNTVHILCIPKSPHGHTCPVIMGCHWMERSLCKCCFLTSKEDTAPWVTPCLRSCSTESVCDSFLPLPWRQKKHCQVGLTSSRASEHQRLTALKNYCICSYIYM